MAGFLRAKQSGLHGDFSGTLGSEDFFRTDIARYGINSQISTIAYDPVQSLLAVGTNESRYGPGQIYIFGQARVSAVLRLPRLASVRSLHFCADKLIAQTSKNELTLFSLETKRILSSFTPVGYISCISIDPSTDWAFVGLKSGDIVIYDLDRQRLAPLKLSYLWQIVTPRARPSPALSISLHPRDLGTILVGFGEGALIYSIKQSKIVRHFQYEVAPGAPGGGGDPGASTRSVRYPLLVQALWHPLGTFILTSHADGSIVFWDPKDGRIVASRNLKATGVHLPERGGPLSPGSGEPFSINDPIFKIAWCCAANPDETGILVAGGGPSADPVKELTFLDFGVTPTYSTSSWQVLSDCFDRPRHQKTLPTPHGFFPVDFCLIPRISPHYSGAQHPAAVIALSASGELQLLAFPSGERLVPTNRLPVCLCMLTPFASTFEVAYASPDRFIGLTEKRSQSQPFLLGGAEATRAMKRFERRTIALTAHLNGAVRAFDLGHGDEISNPLVDQADVSIALNRATDVDITCTAFSAATGELAVGVRPGEIVIFKWDRETSQSGGQFPTPAVENIRSRVDSTLNEGFMPFALIKEFQEPVASVHVSDVGFIVAASITGGILVIDMRGPAVIFNSSISALTANHKRDSRRRSRIPDQAPTPDYVTKIETAVMALDGEDYASIAVFVGTDQGRIITIKLLPRGNGGFGAEPVGWTQVEGRIVSLCPVNTADGTPAVATQQAIAALGRGLANPGALIAVSHQGARIFRPPVAKGAVKAWEDLTCRSANYCHVVERGQVIVGVFGDGVARIFSNPGLKQLGEVKLDGLERSRLDESRVTETGEVIGWTGPSEIAVIGTTCASEITLKVNDLLFNSEAVVPPRPVISGLQWISGTQYVTAMDLDLLIGGPDRPPSKRMKEEAVRQEQEAKRERWQASREAEAGRPPLNGSAKEDEGYWAYMQSQINQRTENLNIVGDSMDRLGESSAKFSNDVSKFVSQQKRKVLIGGLTGKWF